MMEDAKYGEVEWTEWSGDPDETDDVGAVYCLIAKFCVWTDNCGPKIAV